MSYIANHYVSVNGEMYMAGEKIPEGLPPEKIKWFLKTGTIREFIPAETQNGASESENSHTEMQNTQKAKDVLEPQNAQESRNSAEEPDHGQEDEPDEISAPEIDTMAGIIQGEQEKPQEDPTREKATLNGKRGRRKGGKQNESEGAQKQ